MHSSKIKHEYGIREIQIKSAKEKLYIQAKSCIMLPYKDIFAKRIISYFSHNLWTCLSQILRESGFASTVLIIRLLTTKTYVSSIAQGFLASYIKGLVNYLFQYKHHIFLMKLQTEQKYDFLRIEYATITGTLQFMINT